jgi:putative ABC transport system permease protein
LTRAVRNISRRKMRALLVIIALGFSMAIMISVPAGIVANQETTQNLNTYYNNAVSQMEQQLTLITCTNSSSTSSSSGGPFPIGGSFLGFAGFGGAQTIYINESVVMAAISSMSGVEAVAPKIEVGEGWTTETRTSPFNGRTFTFNVSSYTVEGVPLNSSLTDNYSILPTNITAGRNLQQGDTGVVVLSQNNTEHFGVEVGGEVNINGTNFKVVGVHGETGSMIFMGGQGSDVGTLYMNITDAQAVTGHVGEISELDVYAKNSSTTLVNAIASDISTDFPTFHVTTELDQLQSAENRYNSTIAADNISQMQTVAFQEIIVSILATCLIVLFVMMYTVRERTREIGTLKAIGFSNWNVMSQFILEGMLLSLAAGIVGIGIGIVAAPTLSKLLLPLSSPFARNTSGSGGRSFGVGGAGFVTSSTSALGTATAVLSPELMLLALAGAIVLGALGSLYPAWRASRTRPAEAMRYE